MLFCGFVTRMPYLLVNYWYRFPAQYCDWCVPGLGRGQVLGVCMSILGK